MADAGPALLVLLVLAAVGGIIYVAWLMEKQRREAMARLASKLGYSFSAHDGWGIPGRYGQIDLFRRGHSKRARNVIHGERDGSAVMIFDYRYTTGSGKNKSTHSRNVMLVEMPEQRFPELFIRREGFFDKVAAAVGFDDIDFESHEFSRKFYVKSRDKRFAYDVVDARMMEFLLGVGDLNIELEGADLAFYQERKLAVDGIARLHDVAWDFIGHMSQLALDRTSLRAGGRG